MNPIMTAKPITSLFERLDTQTRVFPMKSSRIGWNALRWVAALGFASAGLAGAEIPFPEVLDKAAVVQEKITDVSLRDDSLDTTHAFAAETLTGQHLMISNIVFLLKQQP